MKVILRGPLAQGASRQELRFSFGRAVTREELLAAVGAQAPSVRRYLAMSAETGQAPSLLVLVGGNWVHPGDLVGDEAEVEIHPPIAGGCGHQPEDP